MDNQEEANAVNVENSGLWCPALAGEGPQDCWQNNNCQENGHGRETDEKVIVPEQIALPICLQSLHIRCIFSSFCSTKTGYANLQHGATISLRRKPSDIQ